MHFEKNGRLVDHEVRLFPTVRISSEKEAEMRATASLLSVVLSVPDFGRAVVRARIPSGVAVDAAGQIRIAQAGRYLIMCRGE